MASMAISSATPPAAAQAAQTSKTAAAHAEPAAKAAVLQPDTVKLSVAAQATMMHKQGRSPALIAAMLGTNVTAVDGYLNIKVAPQAATTPTTAQEKQAAPAAQAAPAEQAKPAAPAPPAVPTMTGKD